MRLSSSAIGKCAVLFVRCGSAGEELVVFIRRGMSTSVNPSLRGRREIHHRFPDCIFTVDSSIHLSRFFFFSLSTARLLISSIAGLYLRSLARRLCVYLQTNKRRTPQSRFLSLSFFLFNLTGVTSLLLLLSFVFIQRLLTVTARWSMPQPPHQPKKTRRKS